MTTDRRDRLSDAGGAPILLVRWNVNSGWFILAGVAAGLLSHALR